MVCTTNRKALRRAARVVLSQFLFRPPFGGPGRTNILMFPKKKKVIGHLGDRAERGSLPMISSESFCARVSSVFRQGKLWVLPMAALEALLGSI